MTNIINIKSKILHNIPITLKIKLYRIIEYLNTKNINAYLVGGPVRDILLNKKVKDLDIALETKNIDQITKKISQKLGLKHIYHEQFNTATLYDKKVRIDFSMTRKETYPQPAQLPIVEFSNIIDDLKRRDFTINSIAISLIKKNMFEIVDPTGGVNDLKKKLIKIIHNKSFIDDPTRIFRAIRFKERFNFKIEKNTFKKMNQAIGKNLPKLLSKKRLSNEFLLILKEKKSYQCLRQLKKINSMRYLINLEVPHKKFFKQKDLKIKLASFFLGKKTKEVKEILNTMEIDRSLKNEIVRAYKFINNEIIQTPPDWIKKFAKLSNIKLKKPVITGKDIISLGIKPSPKFKHILKEISEKQRTGEIKTKKAAIKFIIENYIKNK